MRRSKGLARSWLLGVATVALLAPVVARADLIDEEEKPAPAPAPTDAGKDLEDEEGETPDTLATPDAQKSKAPSTSPGKHPSKPSLPDEDVEASKAIPGGKSGGSVLAPKHNGKGGGKTESKEPVHFESRGLKGLREKGTVELMDNVIVEQGTLRLEADQAKVYFDEAAKDVVKVVADGNVKIFKIDEESGEKIKAFGNQVVFDNRQRTVVLEGNARLWRGADLVRGKKITYEMDSGWIRADRVAGEVHPPEKDGPSAGKTPAKAGKAKPKTGSGGQTP